MFAEEVTAFRARREVLPLGPDLPESMWVAARGVDGLEVSGVGIGVAAVEVALLWDGCAISYSAH